MTVQLELAAIVRKLENAPPLTPMSTATWASNNSQDMVLAAIHGGFLQFAFDLARRNAGSREIRVERNALLRWISADYEHMKRAIAAAENPEVLADALRRCVPTSVGFPTTVVRGATLWRAWGISADHGRHLIEDGLITEFRREDRRETQTRLIVRASAIEFLTSRRIT
jgi:hypothetical protein